MDKNGTPERELKAPPAVPSPAPSKRRDSEVLRPEDTATTVVREGEVIVNETPQVAGKKGSARVKSKAVVESEGDDDDEPVETPTRPKPRPVFKKKGVLFDGIVLVARPKTTRVEASSAAAPRDTTPTTSKPVAKSAGKKRKTAAKEDEGRQDVKRRKGRGVTKAYAGYLKESTQLSDVVRCFYL